MDFCVGFGTGFASQVGQSIVIPISKQLGYVFHYKRNINKLKSELEKLEDKKNKIQEIVEEDRKNGHQIVPKAEEWLCNVATTEKELQHFFNDELNKNVCLVGYCPNLVSRRSLSKKAKKWHACVIKLMEEKFDIISHPAPLPKQKPSFIDDIKVSINMRDLHKLPKLKAVKYRIPMFGVRVNMFN